MEEQVFIEKMHQLSTLSEKLMVCVENKQLETLSHVEQQWVALLREIFSADAAQIAQNRTSIEQACDVHAQVRSEVDQMKRVVFQQLHQLRQNNKMIDAYKSS